MFSWSRLCTLALVATAFASQAHALGVRLFINTEECIDAYVDATQWDKMIVANAAASRGYIELSAAFSVLDMQGAADPELKIDYTISDAAYNNVLHTKQAVTEETLRIYWTGPRGPYRLCFKLSQQMTQYRPVANLQISYFEAHLYHYKESTENSGRKAISEQERDRLMMESGKLPTNEDFTVMVQTIDNLANSLHRIYAEGRHIQYLADFHLHALESGSRVAVRYTVASAIVFFTYVALQLFAAMRATSGCTLLATNFKTGSFMSNRSFLRV